MPHLIYEFHFTADSKSSLSYLITLEILIISSQFFECGLQAIIGIYLFEFVDYSEQLAYREFIFLFLLITIKLSLLTFLYGKFLRLGPLLAFVS